MTISESYGATFSFGFEIGTNELQVKLGYSNQLPLQLVILILYI